MKTDSSTKGICPKCGLTNEYSKLVCDTCGGRLPWADAVSPSSQNQRAVDAKQGIDLEDLINQASQKNEGAKQKKIIYSCPHCGAKNSFESTPASGATVRCGSCKQNFNLEADIGDIFSTVFGGRNDNFKARPSSRTNGASAAQVAPTQPLSSGQVDNSYVWALAFAPLVTALALSFLSSAMQWEKDTVSLMTWVFPWAINIGFCLTDHKKLKQSGYDTSGLDGWVCFVVPIYLFLRAEKLRQSNAYAWAWMACFAISFLIPIHYYIPPTDNF